MVGPVKKNLPKMVLLLIMNKVKIPKFDWGDVSNNDGCFQNHGAIFLIIHKLKL